MGRVSLGYADNEGLGWSPHLYCLLPRQISSPSALVEALTSLTLLVRAEHLHSTAYIYSVTHGAAQAGFDLVSPAQASRVLRLTGRCHHIWLIFSMYTALKAWLL